MPLLDEIRAAFRDPSRPLPPAVWVLRAPLLSLSFFLTLRLVMTRAATAALSGSGIEPDRTPTDVHLPPAPPGTAERLALRPPSGPLPRSDATTFKILVESWRRAWEGKDLPGYLAHYARTFGSQQQDYEAWAEHKSRVFASAAPIEVEIRDVQISVRPAIALVSFVQTYRSQGYQDRGRKRLYLLPEGGRWKIFNEEWEPLP